MTPIGPKQPREDPPAVRERSPSPTPKSPDIIGGEADIFAKKLSFCSQPLSVHDGSETEKRDRRRYTQEVIALLASPIKTEQLLNPRLACIVGVVEASLFRPLKKLTPTTAGAETLDKAEQDQLEDPSWLVVGPVYILFTRLLESEAVNQKGLKSLITPQFIQKFIDLFDSEYPLEREALKSCLHLIYLKFVSLRKVVRKTMNELLYRLIHEDYRFNGVSEILEILASIISGFSVPIKEEHLVFFEHVILPLHKVQTSQLFHNELTRCAMLFVQKDHHLGLHIIQYLDKAWPKSNTVKQVAFMEELMMVACLVEPAYLKPQISTLFRRVSGMLMSPHFKVCDFALSCFEKSDMMALVEQFRALIFPLIVPAIEQASIQHWQPTISSSLSGLLLVLQNLDPVLFGQCIGKSPLVDDDSFGNPELRAQKEKIWTQLTKNAKRTLPGFIFTAQPYTIDHLVGEYNGINNTHSITPEIS